MVKQKEKQYLLVNHPGFWAQDLKDDDGDNDQDGDDHDGDDNDGKPTPLHPTSRGVCSADKLAINCFSAMLFSTSAIQTA